MLQGKQPQQKSLVATAQPQWPDELMSLSPSPGVPWVFCSWVRMVLLQSSPLAKLLTESCFSNEPSVLVFPPWYYCNSSLVTSKCELLCFKKPHSSLWAPSSTRLRGICSGIRLILSELKTQGYSAWCHQKVRRNYVTPQQPWYPTLWAGNWHSQSSPAAFITKAKSLKPLPGGCKDQLRVSPEWSLPQLTPDICLGGSPWRNPFQEAQCSPKAQTSQENAGGREQRC